ncbi:hypothetical protein B0H10DRAFT_1964916 [Mycena sp. CBHHK59/15]|nr:hypothetical protein B0H10DRAFT_1964916 [Mycena sp. CBHHK59/15]
MHAALTDISQGGLLGDVEPLLFYGFWNPTSGDLDIGTIHGHLSQNRVNFGGSHSEMQANYGNAWAVFAERPIVQESSVIPRHAFGVPVFPSIVLNIVTPADTQVLLTEYWWHLWAHSWPADSNYPPIPWEAIANNPSGYYDTMRFNLPVPLIAPQRLNTLHTTDSPFIFYPKHQHPTEEETVSRPELGGLGTISNESNSGEPGGASEPVHTPVLDESNSGEPGGASEPVHTPVLDESNSGGPGGASQTIHTSAPHDLNLKKFNAVHTPVPLAESTVIEWTALDPSIYTVDNYWCRSLLGICGLRTLDLFFRSGNPSKHPMHRETIQKQFRELMIGPEADERYSAFLAGQRLREQKKAAEVTMMKQRPF